MQGASEAELARRTAEMQKFQELYRKPLFNIAITFLEPFTFGLIVTLVSAGILRRRRDSSEALANSAGSGLSAVV